MTFAALCTLVTLQNPSYAEAWKFEQAARNAAGAKIFGDSVSREKVSEGIRDLDVVLAYTHRPEIEALEDFLHLQAFVLQRNDIYADQAVGYARLKDVRNLIRCIRELRLNFRNGNPKTVTAAPQNGFYYAQRFANDAYVLALLPNPEIDQEIRTLRFEDPSLAFQSYPYDTAEKARLSEAERIAGLSQLWSEAKFNFANFDLLHALDWNEAYATFLPRVRKAKDRYEYYNVLREFMALLQDGHTDVSLPPKLRAQKEVGVGLSTGLVEKRVVVLDASPDLAKLGISRGDVVETIDGLQAESYGREKWAKRVSSSTPQDKEVRVFGYMLWRGPEGSAVRIRLRKSDGGQREFSLRRTAKAVIAPMPPFEFKILPDGTAYFAFNTCESDAPVEGFLKNLDAIRSAGRLVIDVRRNGGGNGSVGYRILSFLLDQPLPMSKWDTPQYRAVFRAWGRRQERFEGDPDRIKPDTNHFAGPVAVLTSARTFSAAEDFAAACKTSKRVVLVGEPTGGSTGQPLLIRLPGGGAARICTKRDRYPDGTDFVGQGVQPDVRVFPTIVSLQQGGDLPLERALQVVAERGIGVPPMCSMAVPAMPQCDQVKRWYAVVGNDIPDKSSPSFALANDVGSNRSICLECCCGVQRGFDAEGVPVVFQPVSNNRDRPLNDGRTLRGRCGGISPAAAFRPRCAEPLPLGD